MKLIEKKRMLMGVGFTEEQSIMLIMILYNMVYEQAGARDEQVRMVYRKVQSRIHNKEQEKEKEHE